MHFCGSLCLRFASVVMCSQVENVLVIVMQSAHLVTQRKAFQQSMEDVLTLSREQTSSQPLIASALEELKVRTPPQADDIYPVKVQVYCIDVTFFR